MNAFRTLLIVMFLAIAIYTMVVVTNHGFGLLAVFFGDMMAMGWPGQFNLDFMGFLLLSGLWMAWRNHFKPPALALGLLGFFGGAPVLTLYLLYLSVRSDGNMAVMMLGEQRVSTLRN